MLKRGLIDIMGDSIWLGLWQNNRQISLISPEAYRATEVAVYTALSLTKNTGLSFSQTMILTHTHTQTHTHTHTGHPSVDTTEWWWLITDRLPFDLPQSLWITLWQKHIPWCQVCVHLPACLSDSQAPWSLSFSPSSDFRTQIPSSHPCLCLFK